MGCGNAIQRQKIYDDQFLIEFPDELLQGNESLAVLKINDNQISSLPDDIINLKRLQHLYMKKNCLLELPAAIGTLKELEVLDLNANELRTIPKEIGGLSKLRKLDVSENSLSSLPSEIGNLSSLQVLYVEKNQLETLPDTIGMLSNLWELSISHNNIKFLPTELEDLASLEKLNVYGNPIVAMPVQLGALKSLQVLIIPMPEIPHIQIHDNYMEFEWRLTRSCMSGHNYITCHTDLVFLWQSTGCGLLVRLLELGYVTDMEFECIFDFLIHINGKRITLEKHSDYDGHEHKYQSISPYYAKRLLQRDIRFRFPKRHVNEFCQ